MNDVALVVLDTLRKDAFDEHFDWLPGTRFENAWSTSHWTGAVHGSMFTGRYPGEVGTYAQNRTFDYPEPVLPERLVEAGYETRAYSCNVIVSSEFGFDRGFETFEGSWNVERALTDGAVFDWHTLLREDQDLRTYAKGFREAVAGDADTVASLWRGVELASGRRALDYGAERAVETLGDATFEGDAFLYVNLMEAHAPYRPPPAYRTVDDYETPDHPLYLAPDADPDEVPGETSANDALRTAADGSGESPSADDGTKRGRSADESAVDPVAVRRAYDDSVRYLSETYRRLFGSLRESFDYVFTVGDHGELFGEHGFYEHTYGVYPEVTHVPLAIWGEDVGDQRREETVSLLDVHRTIAGLAGVDADGCGQDLLDDPASRTYLTEYRGIPHPRQVASLTDLGVPPERVRAYDEPRYGIAFPDGAVAYQVPEGLRTRGGSPDDAAARLEERLAELDVRETVEDPTVDPGVVDRLEHLGYV